MCVSVCLIYRRVGFCSFRHSIHFQMTEKSVLATQRYVEEVVNTVYLLCAGVTDEKK